MLKPNSRKSRGPSLQKTAATQRLIIDAALAVFLEQGFAAAKVSDIANRAGLGKGTLYSYHATKEALFEAVVKHVIADPLADAQVPTVGQSVKEALKENMLPILQTFESSGRGALVRLIVAETTRFPDMADLYRRLVLDPMAKRIGTLAEHARQNGELKSDALERFPLLLMSPALLCTLWNGLYGKTDPMPIEDVFAGMLDLVFTQ